jgi:alkylated DNA nucleotide flippase Atl1
MRAVVALVVCVVAFWPEPGVQAWGFDVHRFITRRALESLPPEIKPFYDVQRDFIVEHSVDPDLWRVAELRSARGPEDPNHFLDIDGLDEPRPFTNVPREWDAYVARYGEERANRMGRLPWRVEDIYKLLVARFRDVAKGTPAYAADNARYLTAVLAHYIEDAHVPFHAVLNYDGQSTNQRGIHSRFENELIMRNLKTLKLTPVKIEPFSDVREFVFARLVEGEALVGGILDADRKAAAGREFYDDVFYAAFLTGARATAERRVSDAASGVASTIVSAWIEAGRPVLPATRPNAPVRIRR